MIRLVGAVGAMSFVLALAGTMVSDGRSLAAALLAIAAICVLVGVVTNPLRTAVATIALVCVGLVWGGHPMEGTGMLLLIGATVYRRTAAPQPDR